MYGGTHCVRSTSAQDMLVCSLRHSGEQQVSLVLVAVPRQVMLFPLEASGVSYHRVSDWLGRSDADIIPETAWTNPQTGSWRTPRRESEARHRITKKYEHRQFILLHWTGTVPTARREYAMLDSSSQTVGMLLGGPSVRKGWREENSPRPTTTVLSCPLRTPYYYRRVCTPLSRGSQDPEGEQRHPATLQNQTRVTLAILQPGAVSQV